MCLIHKWVKVSELGISAGYKCAKCGKVKMELVKEPKPITLKTPWQR